MLGKKARMCVFNSSGKCRSGDNCKYAHDPRELKNPKCYRCFCASPTCPYAHTDEELEKITMRKTTMCLYFKDGRCRAGNACRHAHNVEDLDGGASSSILGLSPSVIRKPFSQRGGSSVSKNYSNTYDSLKKIRSLVPYDQECLTPVTSMTSPLNLSPNSIDLLSFMHVFPKPIAPDIYAPNLSDSKKPDFQDKDLDQFILLMTLDSILNSKTTL